MRPPVGSKNRQARFTRVDFPAPVSPTMATVDPAGTSRLKCSSTFSVPSGYRKVTSSKVMWPMRGSQFSRLGSKLVPYFSMTSGVSVIWGLSSIRAETRSMLAWVEMKLEMVLARVCTGSAMPRAKFTKMVSSPMPMSPHSTMLPPPVMTKATAKAVRKPMMGTYTAFNSTPRTMVARIRLVTSRKAWVFWSSMTRVLEVLAPEMPSL